MQRATRTCRASHPIAIVFCLFSIACASRSLTAQSAVDTGPAPPMDICEADLGPPLADGAVTSGTLLLETDQPGLFVPAPVVETAVDLRVRGIVVRGRLRQTFRNPTAFWVAGRYVFPLPENAAVDRLRMRVGERIIEGEIQERRQAQETFERAAREGRRASLVAQQRPNVFTAEIANMGPGEEIEIEIGYLQTLRWVDGGYRLRFPTVVAPRFGGLSEPDLGADGRPRVILPCADVPRFSASTSQSAEVSPLELSVEIEAGGPLASLESPSHTVEITVEHPFLYQLQLRDRAATDRDFELTWRPVTLAAAAPRVFVEQHGGEFFTLLMLYPPAPDAARELSLPREIVFVIDSSGSMHGESLAQAKSALVTALGRLRPEDHFNVIQFNSKARMLFDGALPVGRYSLQEATDYVTRLEANGGTNILAALTLALRDDGGSSLRQIVFITDGAVGNEEQLFRYLRAHLGDSRLFTVGIGSAPNSFFMRKAAQFGRGTFTHIGSVDQVAARMDELLHKLESPVLTDLVADWGDPSIEAFPQRVPDLYAGEPLVVVGRGDTPLAGLTLSGARGAVPWKASVSLPEARGQGGLAKLWARRKLGALNDALLVSEDPEPLHSEALELALGFGLVSRFTSLVAVERTPVWLEGEQAVTRLIPLRMPAGWQPSAAVIGLPATATAARVWLRSGLLAMLAALLLGLGLRPGRRHRARG